MRITCHSLADFLENLESHSTVFDKTVYYDRTRRRLDRMSHSFEVTYQASAILELDHESQALLQCGIDCGIDRETADGGNEGTNQQREYHKQLIQFCHARGLRVLPGIIDS